MYSSMVMNIGKAERSVPKISSFLLHIVHRRLRVSVQTFRSFTPRSPKLPPPDFMPTRSLVEIQLSYTHNNLQDDDSKDFDVLTSFTEPENNSPEHETYRKYPFYSSGDFVFPGGNIASVEKRFQQQVGVHFMQYTSAFCFLIFSYQDCC